MIAECSQKFDCKQKLIEASPTLHALWQHPWTALVKGLLSLKLLRRQHCLGHIEMTCNKIL